LPAAGEGGIPTARAVNKNTELCSVFLFIRAKRDRKRTGGNELSRRSADRGVASADKSELAQLLAPPLGNERASDGERVRRNSCHYCIFIKIIYLNLINDHAKTSFLKILKTVFL